jgi:hypothetical protein
MSDTPNGLATPENDQKLPADLASTQEVCAAMLSTGKTLMQTATTLGVSRKLLSDWWAKDKPFRAMVEQFRSQFVATSQAQLYTRLVVDAPHNLDVMMEIRDDPNCMPSTRLQAAKTLMQAVLDGVPHDRTQAAPGVSLPPGIMKALVEAQAHFDGREEHEIVAEYNLIVDEVEEEEIAVGAEEEVTDEDG